MNAACLFTVTMMVGAELALASFTAAGDMSYQLEFTAEVTRTQYTGVGPPVIETQRLAGGFRLVRTIGPHDWTTFLVEQIAFTTTGKSGGAVESVLLTGAGTYRYGGRGEPQEAMTLQLDVDGALFEVASGLVPMGDDWPVLGVLLKGSRQIGTVGGAHEDLEIWLNAVPASRVTRYRLLPGSTFTDACLVCGRPDIIEPITGRFNLSLIDENPLFSWYAILDARFENRSGDAIFRTLWGGGRYSIGGEVAVVHPMRLDVAMAGLGVDREAALTNNPAAAFGRWPMIVEDLTEEGGSDLSAFRLQVRSAPVRALWFTTSNGMTPGALPPRGIHLEGGDLLDDSGRVVKTLADLLNSLELTPGAAVHLDAFTIGPGGEVWFSLAEDAESARLGLIQEGDVVSDRGRRVFSNQELTRNLGFMPVVPDLGLDGLQVLPDGEVLFSTRHDQFSERLGTIIRHADIVSAKGTVVHRGKDLLAPFDPKAAPEEIGLDAFHVWASGEVWFSTADGFQSGASDITGVLDGDLLSSDGQIVYRNLDLVREFQPLEDLANFGLTGLFVVTDMAATAGAPDVKVGPSGTPNQWEVSWSSAGRVFQVETTADLRLPFGEKEPIGVEQTYRWIPRGTEFLRIRQW